MNPLSRPGATPSAVRIVRESWRYLAASALALAVDYGLLLALTELAHLPYLVSSAISFSVGAILHYGLSITLVFSQRRLSDWRVELTGFLIIGLAGLAVTQGVLTLTVEVLGLSYMIGKILAAGLSFVMGFVARRAVLFTGPKVAS